MLVVANTTRGHVLADRVRPAKTFVSRIVGLLSTPSLAEGEGLWLSPCKSIHTFFMRYPIDVLFLDAEGTLLYAATVAPWRATRIVFRSHGVLELPSGTLQKAETRIGDKIMLTEREY